MHEPGSLVELRFATIDDIEAEFKRRGYTFVLAALVPSDDYYGFRWNGKPHEILGLQTLLNQRVRQIARSLKSLDEDDG